MTHDARVVVIGAGIVGLATARALQLAGLGPVVVLDKEHEVARHQSGRNSGVVHSGIYYAPASLKASLVRSSRQPLERLAETHSIPFERCGKVIVATTSDELVRLRALAVRGAANGLEVALLDRAGLVEHEPGAEGVGAVHVATTAITDFREIAQAMALELINAGGEVRVGFEVDRITATGDGIAVRAGVERITASWLVACAGLHSDRVARLASVEPRVQIVPFRGEYFTLYPEAARRVRHLIYPVPDPRFPFLGVHLTRMVDGTVHVGPNAVAALAREGYRWRDIDRRHLTELAASPAVRRLAREHWRPGGAEMLRSVSRRHFAAAAASLVPGIEASDLRPAEAGVRAQALHPDGSLVDDFLFVDGPRALHVVNAPSPAATASLGIAAAIVERVRSRMEEHGTA